MTITEDTDLDVIAVLSFKYSSDSHQSAVDLQKDLEDTDLTVIQGFGDEYAYYLVEVKEKEPLHMVKTETENIEIGPISSGGGSTDSDDHPLDPDSYQEPSVDDGCGSRSEEGNAFEVTD